MTRHVKYEHIVFECSSDGINTFHQMTLSFIACAALSSGFINLFTILSLKEEAGWTG